MRRIAVLFAVLVFVLATLIVFDRPVNAQNESIRPAGDNTLTRIELRSDGSARWTIEVRTRLNSSEEVEVYEEFLRGVGRNASRYSGTFERRMEGVVANAGRSTGRNMSAGNFSASARIQEFPRRWGIVALSFVWENFSRIEDDRLIVGDVFGNGFFLSEGDVLRLEAPADYLISGVAPEPEERTNSSVEWTGRRDFSEERPLVVVEAAGSASGGGNWGPTPPMWFSIAVILIAVPIGYALYRKDVSPFSGTEKQVEGEVLTDSERVENLLEIAGGRLEQSRIAEELDWSDSKTSRVIGRMSERGDVEKLRRGKGNIVELKDRSE